MSVSEKDKVSISSNHGKNISSVPVNPVNLRTVNDHDLFGSSPSPVDNNADLFADDFYDMESLADEEEAGQGVSTRFGRIPGVSPEDIITLVISPHPTPPPTTPSSISSGEDSSSPSETIEYPPPPPPVLVGLLGLDTLEILTDYNDAYDYNKSNLPLIYEAFLDAYAVGAAIGMSCEKMRRGAVDEEFRDLLTEVDFGIHILLKIRFLKDVVSGLVCNDKWFELQTILGSAVELVPNLATVEAKQEKGANEKFYRHRQERFTRHQDRREEGLLVSDTECDSDEDLEDNHLSINELRARHVYSRPIANEDLPGSEDNEFMSTDDADSHVATPPPPPSPSTSDPSSFYDSALFRTILPSVEKPDLQPPPPPPPPPAIKSHWRQDADGEKPEVGTPPAPDFSSISPISDHGRAEPFSAPVSAPISSPLGSPVAESTPLPPRAKSSLIVVLKLPKKSLKRKAEDDIDEPAAKRAHGDGEVKARPKATLKPGGRRAPPPPTTRVTRSRSASSEPPYVAPGSSFVPVLETIEGSPATKPEAKTSGAPRKKKEVAAGVVNGGIKKTTKAKKPAPAKSKAVKKAVEDTMSLQAPTAHSPVPPSRSAPSDEDEQAAQTEPSSKHDTAIKKTKSGRISKSITAPKPKTKRGKRADADRAALENLLDSDAEEDDDGDNFGASGVVRNQHQGWELGLKGKQKNKIVG